MENLLFDHEKFRNIELPCFVLPTTNLKFENNTIFRIEEENHRIGETLNTWITWNNFLFNHEKRRNVLKTREE